MRVLVTGGAGYVGSHAAKLLAESGHHVVIIDNLANGHRAAVGKLPLVVADLLDQDRIIRLIKDERIDAVMHFAALAYVGVSVTEPAKYYQNNIVGTLALLDAMRETGVERIVFSSTCATYGNPAARADFRGPSATANQPVRLHQAGDRAGAGRLLAGLRPRLCRAAVFQRIRCGGRRHDRRGPRSGNAPHSARVAGGAWGSASLSKSTAPTTRRPTAPAFAITFMSTIWRPPTWRRWRSSNAAWSSSSISARVTAQACRK